MDVMSGGSATFFAEFKFFRRRMDVVSLNYAFLRGRVDGIVSRTRVRP